jgi:hypothetical protein
VRDSDLPSTAKLVAFVLSTYMDRNGHAWPSKETIAAGASLSRRAVDPAIDRLEGTGLIQVERSRSRRGNRYRARGAQFKDGRTAHLTTGTAHLTTGTAHQVRTKASKAEKASLTRKKSRSPSARQVLSDLDGVLDR